MRGGLKYVVMTVEGQCFLMIQVTVTNSTHKRHEPKRKTINKNLMY